MYVRAAFVSISLLMINPVFSANKVKVPAGSFQMGCSVADSDCGDDEGPQGGVTVHLNTFFIDKNEVSVAEYRNCMKNGSCTRPKDFKHNKYCNLDSSDNREAHPINCVDWSEAEAYCAWVKGRLPYEAEWEKAARAGSTSRYPWGQSVTCQQAILDDGTAYGPVPNEPDGCGFDRTWDRGSKAANKLGLFDMHGNAGEWTANWYSKNAISKHYAKGNIKSPESGRQRVVRGGSWDENRSNLRSSYRNVKPPVSGRSIYGSIGFRCAYDK